MTKIVASVTGSISYSQKGEKGDNAVVYRLDATPSYISLDADGDINRNNEYSARKYMLIQGYRIDGSERQNQWKSDKGLVTVQLSFNDGAVWTEYTTDPYLEQPRVDFDPQYLDSYGSISDEFSNTGLLNARVVMYVGSAVDPKDLTDDIILARMEIPVVQDGASGGKGPVIRQHRGFESGSYSYYSGKGHSEEFLDVVYVGKKWYRCTSTYATSSPSVTDGHWEVFSNFTSIATDILLAENASIDMLTGNEVNLYNPSDNSLYGSFRVVDNNDDYSLWVGGKTGSNANFAVTRGGSLRASDANITGTINATKGKIAGFTISGNGLTNEPFDNDAYIVFRNDSHDCFAGIGGNVMPTSSGMRAVARFENEDTTDQWGLGYNIAAIFSAKNGGYNFAFTGSGNGVLNGWIGGYKLSHFSIGKDNTIYRGYVKISENNTWFIYSHVDGSGITLPGLDEVRCALGIDNSTHFAVRFTIAGEPGTKHFNVYGRNKLKDANEKTPWDTDNMPTFFDKDGNVADYVEVGPGDVVTFLLAYYDYVSYLTVRYTARIASHAY